MRTCVYGRYAHEILSSSPPRSCRCHCDLNIIILRLIIFRTRAYLGKYVICFIVFFIKRQVFLFIFTTTEWVLKGQKLTTHVLGSYTLGQNEWNISTTPPHPPPPPPISMMLKWRVLVFAQLHHCFGGEGG